MQNNPHALVSGGTRGLGASVVTDLLNHGFRVSTFGRKATPFVEQCKAEHSDRFLFLCGDMSDPDSLAKIVGTVGQRLGPIDNLINNAGIAVDGLLATMPDDQIERVISVNLAGTLRLTRLVVRRMLLQRRGAIVNISSIIGLRGYNGLTAYAATKAGINGMTLALARELGPVGIRVNCIAPGYLLTEMTHGLDDAQRQQIVRRTPLDRLGTPEDVVGLLRFLLAHDSSFITGQVIAVDGGITC